MANYNTINDDKINFKAEDKSISIADPIATAGRNHRTALLYLARISSSVGKPKSGGKSGCLTCGDKISSLVGAPPPPYEQNA